jgi:hypothetical protein
MRHRRLAVIAYGAWAVAVVAGLAANPVDALAWLVPIAVVSTVALFFRVVRTLAWVLPVAVVAGPDASTVWWRVGLVLVSVVVAVLVVGLLDAWADSRPDRWESGQLDPADQARWRRERWAGFVGLGGLLLGAAAVWTALTVGSWSAPGWLLALLPAAAALAIAAAGWPLWRPNPSVP